MDNKCVWLSSPTTPNNEFQNKKAQINTCTKEEAHCSYGCGSSLNSSRALFKEISKKQTISNASMESEGIKQVAGRDVNYLSLQ